MAETITAATITDEEAITIITREQADQRTDDSPPHGLWLIAEPDGSFTAVDNTTADKFTENFPTQKIAEAWLCGEFEMSELEGRTFDQLLTPAQKRFIALEKRKPEIKQFYDDLKAATAELVAEHGVGFYFQDYEGTVYKTVEVEGKFINFDRFGVDRTRRADEKQGSLSLKEAEAAGFAVESKKLKKAEKAE